MIFHWTFNISQLEILTSIFVTWTRLNSSGTINVDASPRSTSYTLTIPVKQHKYLSSQLSRSMQMGYRWREALTLRWKELRHLIYTRSFCNTNWKSNDCAQRSNIYPCFALLFTKQCSVHTFSVHTGSGSIQLGTALLTRSKRWYNPIWLVSIFNTVKQTFFFSDHLLKLPTPDGRNDDACWIEKIFVGISCFQYPLLANVNRCRREVTRVKNNILFLF